MTANNESRVYGALDSTLTPDNAFGFHYSGFVNGESSSAVSGSPSCTSTDTATTPPGNYPITCANGSLSAANYSFTFAPGTLTITQASTTTAVTFAGGATTAVPDSGGHTTLVATVKAAAPSTGTPCGSVQFMLGSANLGGPVTLCPGTAGQATASLTTTALTASSCTANSYNVSAAYSGDTNFSGSTSPSANLTVLPPSPFPSTLGFTVAVFLILPVLRSSA